MKKTAAITGAVILLTVAMYHAAVTPDGEILYNRQCSACHAKGIAGAPLLGDADAWAPRIAKGKEALYASVLNGLNGMPPRGGKTDASSEEIESAVDYMVSRSGR